MPQPWGEDSERRLYQEALAQVELADKLGIDYLDRRAALIGAVTLDEARALAPKLFDPAKLSFAVVGDPQNLKSTRQAPARAE